MKLEFVAHTDTAQPPRGVSNNQPLIGFFLPKGESTVLSPGKTTWLDFEMTVNVGVDTHLSLSAYKETTEGISIALEQYGEFGSEKSFHLKARITNLSSETWFSTTKEPILLGIPSTGLNVTMSNFIVPINKVDEIDESVAAQKLYEQLMEIIEEEKETSGEVESAENGSDEERGK